MNLINIQKTAIAVVTAASMMLLTSTAFSVSTAVKAKDLRHEALNLMVYIDVPIKNFYAENDEMKQNYEKIKKTYKVGLAFYFEENWVEAYYSFLDVQKQLEKMYEKVSLDYIDRTAAVMHESVKGVVDMQVEYDKKSEVVRRFLTPHEPQVVTVPYDQKTFHYTYDKHDIVDNLEYGYGLLGAAKRARQKGVDIELYLEHDKKLEPRQRSKRLYFYKASIDLSRQSKLNAMHVFQLTNRNKIYENQKKHYGDPNSDANDNPYHQERKLHPVFDVRVPEEYHVDFNDSLNRVHQLEKETYIDLKYHKKGKGQENAENNNSENNTNG